MRAAEHARTWRGASAAAISVLLFASPVLAAVSECLPEMAGRKAEARTEIGARKAALDDWMAKARAIGPGYTRWQIAFNRRIDCTRIDPNRFQCQAIALPCTVKQVPNPDLPRLKRGVPQQ